MDRSVSWLRATAARLLSLGTDPRDTQELRARKALLVGLSLMVLPAGVLWGAADIVDFTPLSSRLRASSTTCGVTR